MARSRKKMALYEVIGKTWPKSGHAKTVEKLHPEKSAKDEPVAEDATTQRPERAIRWLKRPRIVQFNAGRIELSMPYQLAIALLLAIVLLILISYRLGQISYLSKQKPIDSSVNRPGPIKKTTPNVRKSEPVVSKGDNRIVIQTYKFSADLEPVKRHFAQAGIETEIRKIGNWYYLLTKDKYENPKRQGTDGNIARQKIIEWGAKYKAPPGFETFAPKLFSDAYGMKFED